MQNELITINAASVAVKEYNGQRVVTLRDIDEVHQRPEGTARKRFNDNKEHLISGTDYFVRKTDEALSEYGITAPNGLTLITESGYLMLVKSFTDELAWTVQRQIVNEYFRVKTTAKPLTAAQMFALQAQINVELEQKVSEIAQTAAESREIAEQAKQSLEGAVGVFAAAPLNSRDNWTEAMNKTINAICMEHGLSQQNFRGDLYEELEALTSCDLGTRQSNLRNRMRKNGATYKEAQAVTKLQVIARDDKLRPAFELIVRNHAAKRCAG